jgi:hypothetical protein
VFVLFRRSRILYYHDYGVWVFSGPGGKPVTYTMAALAPDGAENKGGSVTFAQLWKQLVAGGT